MRGVRNLRAVWAWLCIAAWLVMLIGPLLHAAGHEDDHVHVHGSVVRHHKHHSGETPRDLIAQARLADLPTEDGAPHDEPEHGFDATTHFVGAAPLLLAPVIVALVPLPLTRERPTSPPAVHYNAATQRLPHARGPPELRTLDV